MNGHLLSLVLPRVRELTAYHLERHDAGIKLDQNENGLGLAEPIREEIARRLVDVAVDRYPIPGQPVLREALARATGWPAEGIVVDNGSDQLLHTFARTFLEPGRVALAPTPSFFVYSLAVRLAGAELVEVPLDDNYRYVVDALLEAVAERQPHVVFLCSPNNPTGSTLQFAELERIVAAAPGMVVLDEAYWEFAGWNARELMNDHPNLAIFRTFSKALAMAGIRLGYLLVQPEFRDEIVKVQPPFPVDCLAREAALVGLEHYDLARERAREIVKARDALYQRLEALEGIEVFPSQTNFLLIRARGGAAATYRGLLERGIVVRDVSAHPLLRDCLRVSIGTADENESVYTALRDMMTP